MATRSQSSPQSRADTEPEFVPVERASNVLDLIGNTPLLEITRLTEGIIAPAVRIFAKLEGFNPGGSVKDRAARSMILRGIESGELRARKSDHRLHFRQYRHRACDGRGGARLSGRAGDGVQREPRAQTHHRGIRREDHFFRSDGAFGRRDPLMPENRRGRIRGAISNPTNITTKPTHWRILKLPGGDLASDRSAG